MYDMESYKWEELVSFDIGVSKLIKLVCIDSLSINQSTQQYSCKASYKFDILNQGMKKRNTCSKYRAWC